MNLFRAQTAESRLLAEYAQKAITAGDALKGISLALLGLQNTLVDDPRPRIRETFVALDDAFRANRLVARLPGHTQCLNTAAFSPDGDLIVTTSNDATARLWDAKSGVQIRVLSEHFDNVVNAEFSPDGTTLATASTDNFVRLWDRQGTLLHELQHESRIHAAFDELNSDLLTILCVIALR